MNLDFEIEKVIVDNFCNQAGDNFSDEVVTQELQNNMTLRITTLCIMAQLETYNDRGLLGMFFKRNHVMPKTLMIARCIMQYHTELRSQHGGTDATQQ